MTASPHQLPEAQPDFDTALTMPVAPVAKPNFLKAVPDLLPGVVAQPVEKPFDLEQSIRDTYALLYRPDEQDRAIAGAANFIDHHVNFDRTLAANDANALLWGDKPERAKAATDNFLRRQQALDVQPPALPSSNNANIKPSVLTATTIAALGERTPNDSDAALDITADSRDALAAPTKASVTSGKEVDPAVSFDAVGETAGKFIPGEKRPASTRKREPEQTRRERRAEVKEVEVQKREAAWTTARDAKITEEFNATYKSALIISKQARALAQQEITEEDVEAAIEGIRHLAVADGKGTLPAIQQELVDDAEHRIKNIRNELESKQIESLDSIEASDPAGAAILRIEGALGLARTRYAETIAKTRTTTFGKTALTGEVGYNDQDERGRLTKAIGRFGIGRKLPEHGSARDDQFEYEVKLGVLERLIRQQVIDKNPDATPEVSLRLQNEAVLSRMLINGSVDRQGRQRRPELFKLNDMIVEQRKLSSGHYVRENGVVIEKQTYVDDNALKVFNNKFRKARLGFYKTWNRWSNEGKKGALKKIGTGVGLGLVSTGAGAVGLTASVGSGIGLAVGVGIAMRLSRTIGMSQVNKKADKLQAVQDASVLNGEYVKFAKDIKEHEKKTGESYHFGIDDMRAAINMDHTEKAKVQRRRNRIRAAAGAISVASMVGGGALVEGLVVHAAEHAFHTISNSWNANVPTVSAPSTTSHGLSGSSKDQLLGHHSTASGSSRTPAGAGQGQSQVSGNVDTTPEAGKGGINTTGTVNTHGQHSGIGQGHSQVNGTETSKPPVVPAKGAPVTGVVPQQAPTNLVSIKMSDVNSDRYISQVYNHAFGNQGYAQMQADANAAVSRGDVLKVLNDPSDPDNWYLKLTKQGAAKIGMTKTSSSTADVMKVLSQGSSKFKLVA